MISPANWGMGEMLIILIIVIVLFGAGKAPAVLRDLGKGLREFKKSVNEKEGPTDEA